jgi:adenylate kinase
MRVILLGAPGAGKGSQAVLLSEKLNIPHISTGDIFRSNIRENTTLGSKVKNYMDKGVLVPDELTVEIIKDRFLKEDCREGFILDGFPRTITQAEYLDKTISILKMEIDYAVDIYAPDEVIIKRLSGRRICSVCGKNYHIKTKPPVREGICDECGGKLVQRNDDREEIIRKRLETYHIETEPLIDYYKGRGKLLRVDGRGSIEETYEGMLSVLGMENDFS